MLYIASAGKQYPGTIPHSFLQAIDASIRWWQGKPAPRASALRAPWSLSPNLQKSPNNSSATGISKFCPTKSHAIHRLSRQCSLSMLRCLTNCATTNKRSPNGPPIPMLNAAAKDGLSTTRRRLARERKRCFSSSSEDGSRKR